MEGSLLLFVIF